MIWYIYSTFFSRSRKRERSLRSTCRKIAAFNPANIKEIQKESIKDCCPDTFELLDIHITKQSSLKKLDINACFIYTFIQLLLKSLMDPAYVDEPSHEPG